MGTKDTVSNSESSLSSIAKMVQILFCLLIGFLTILNQCHLNEQFKLNSKNSKLMYRPVVGVFDVEIVYATKGAKPAHYRETETVAVKFTIKNVGQFPAKNLFVILKATMDDYVFPAIDQKEDEKTVLVQGAKGTFFVRIDHPTIVKMAEKRKEVNVTFDISYQDWEGFDKYTHTARFKIRPININPFTITVEGV